MTDKAQLTPLMQQYMTIRKQYPDMLLLFQVGDFFELFFEDAKRASVCLGIALTKRGHVNGEPIPLCGVPVHALQHYIIKLVRLGFKVALCEQLEEPVPGKVVERGVTQVLTPGTLTDTYLLDEKSASYLCTLFPMQGSWGLLFSELLTAQLFGTVLQEGQYKQLESEIARFMPDEIVLPHTASGKSFVSYFKKLGYFTSFESSEQQADQNSEFTSWVARQFHENTQQLLLKQCSLKAALHSFYTYIRNNNKQALDQFHALSWYEPDDFLVLDAATQHNLELVHNQHDRSKKGTLFEVLDKATTSMGSRMIKKWIARPLVRKEQICNRQHVVDLFVKELPSLQQLARFLKEVGDLERVVGRIALRRAQLADYLMLKQALKVLPDITHLLKTYKSDILLHVIMSHIIDFATLHQLLEAALYVDDDKQWLIRAGFDKTLDHVRELIEHSNGKLLELERQEQQKTGISSLKIRFTAIYGYYIEVTKANLPLVPDYYVRQQTLVNRERFTMPQLQQLQAEINHAQQQVGIIEKEIFEQIKKEVVHKIAPLRKLAQALANLDALFGLAHAARDYGWVRPTFNDHRTIAILAGRHPVIESLSSDSFIPNDTMLDDTSSLWIITGPNMGGKSTYLRQVALICILAQIGSYVPADSADISILDRIFTRIGSGDHLMQGKSTFLIEMEETATICTQATDRSLVILDEVGRGTSTFDGLAIAQAVIEHIYTNIGARCLFATHYHELAKLQEQFPGMVSYHAASKKSSHGVTFLYKIKQGVADGSFGIQVAKLAGLPEPILERARDLLEILSIHEDRFAQQLDGGGQQPAVLMDLKHRYKALEEAYRQLQQKGVYTTILQPIDFDTLSPKQAFDILWKLKEKEGV